MKLIIDTNLIFSALLRFDTPEFQFIRSRTFEVYVLQFTTVELFKHKERILKYTRLSESEVYQVYHVVLRHLRIFQEADIQEPHWIEARRPCADVDPKDAVYVAAALSLDAFVWTGDKQLREGLTRKGFSRFRSTSELMAAMPGANG